MKQREMLQRDPDLDDYYESEEWKELRGFLLWHLGESCQRCKTTERPLHVHHRMGLARTLSLGLASLDDYVSRQHNYPSWVFRSHFEILCQRCHERHHANYRMEWDRIEVPEEWTLRACQYCDDEIGFVNRHPMNPDGRPHNCIALAEAEEDP